MRKELRPVHDIIACDRCGRTILKGERIETFVGSGARRQVCELCSLQALRAGWMREATLEEQAAERERRRPRRSLWSRAVQWVEEQGLGGVPPSTDGADELPAPDADDRPLAARHGGDETEPAEERTLERGERGAADPAAGPHVTDESTDDGYRHERARRPGAGASRRAEERRRFGEPDRVAEASDEPEDELARPAAWARRPSRSPGGTALKELLGGRRRELREVHAVPTSREAKVDLAFELFNASEHRRTIAGIARALGEPWVSAAPVDDTAAASEVGIVVAWELSWYRYRVDLSDADQAVLLLDRGDEVEDLDEGLRDWNAGAAADGRLALAAEPVS